MAAETLRALSRTYAAGELDRESYRLERRRLLEAVTEGSTPVIEFTAPEPEAPTVFPYDDDDGDTTQEIIPTVGGNGEADASVEKKQQRRLAIIALTLLVAGMAAWLMLRGDGDPGLPQAPAPAAVTAPRAPPSLFDDFLGANTWSETSMSALGRAWDALDDAARAELTQSTSLVRLTDAIVEQINSQSALIDLGQPEVPLEAQARLLDLAGHLGLEDARLDEARAGWVAATAALSNVGTAPFEPAVPSPAPARSPAATTATPAAAADETLPEAVEPMPRVEPEPEPVPQAVAEPIAAPSAAATATAEVTPASTPPATASEPAGSAAAAASAKAASRSNCTPELARTRRPYCIDLLHSGQKGPVLVVLPAGSFTMGGTKAEEQPRHEVAIDYPLAVGMFEVSVAELETFCRSSGQTCPQQPWPDPKLPAVNVSIALATAYTAWLSDITGATYRLPSEAEWEYAARGGRQSPYPFGDDVLPTDARFSYGNTETQPTAANDRSLNRNDFRLYHIAGNVRELTRDGWREDYADAPADGSAVAVSGSAVAARGGSYADGSDQLRSAARVRVDGGKGDRYTGFRVVRLLAE